MTGYKMGMAKEAVIADLTAKLAECQAQKEAALRIAEQHADVVNNMIQQLAECHNYLQQVQAWQQEGEDIANAGKLSLIFKLAEWWADRPWRTE